ncbi:MAG: O-antigen ligase family protein [Methylobacteriaceae bacterium]|nr:O-antigen ligase family protein [Methylobacteriaceae bacterium]
MIEFFRFLSLLILYWAICDQPSHLKKMYWITGAFAISVCLLSLGHLDLSAQRAATGLAAVGRFRGTGITTHPNNFGFIAIIGSSFSLSLVLNGRRPTLVELAAIFSSLSVAVVCLYASDSRTAWITGIIVSLLFAWSLALPARFRTIIGFGPGWRPAMLLLTIFALCTPLMLTLLGSDGHSFSTTESYAESDAARLTLWRNALIGFEAHPMTGVGLGLTLQETYNPLLKAYNIAPYAHNAVLNMMRISGLPGLLFLSVVVAQSVALMLPDPKRYDFRMPVQLWFFFASSIIATLVSSVIEGGLQNNYGVDCFIAIALGALASARQEKKPARRFRKRLAGATS